MDDPSTLLLVTGGSAGIGAALVAAAPPGTRTVDVSRRGNPDADRHVDADLADPGTWGDVGEIVAAEVAAFAGRRVTFVHAAGVLTPIGFAGEVPTDAYAASVLLNAAAGQVLGHAFLAAVRDRDDLRRELVLVSSGAARRAYAGWSAYGAGKAALEHWVRAVGEEQQQRGGVTVCAIAPGVVATDMQASIRETSPDAFPSVERFRQLHARGELRPPDEVARQLWEVLDDDLAPGAVLDLRDR